jgi:hypothetical protein
MLAPRPTPKLEDHHLSVVRGSLFSIFGSSPPSTNKDAPFRGDMDLRKTERSHAHPVISDIESVQLTYRDFSQFQIVATQNPFVDNEY